MNKLMYLYEYELKRNIKAYLAVIALICVSLFLLILNNLNNYNYVIKEVFKNKSIENTIGFATFGNIIPSCAVVIFIIGLLICNLYSFIIWRKDFSGKNKSIYTLLMIPENRMKIYISKLLNIVSFTYMFIIAFVATLFVSYCLLSEKMSGDTISFGFAQDTIYKFGSIIPYNFIDFIVGYVLLLTATISFIFTLILLNKSIKKCSAILKLILFTVLIYFWIGIIVTTFFFSKNVILGTILYSSITIVVCFFISKNILNNKIEF
ncbi:hypothetical protein CHL78_008680 [Romboutsia weinsteinii]|uniref:Uncharacterized protein n=1 Tax=Romboutsia weinsteinii TaxID=2020949 RepID=A0A371J415_9FIRM|nr:hypothetical protein [Romboutsia weinsteinii]RDY27531.1 hypothetical protein CHL78_008680 [Romboutsia weinsteinii]